MRIFFVFLILTLGCSGKDSASQEENEMTDKDPQVPSLADLKFTDLEGNSFTGEKYLGKPVFIHFWATWCGPCIKEMPTIAGIMEEYEEITYVFPSDEELKTIERFKKSRQFSFSYVQLTSGFAPVGVSSLPTTYLFGKDGELKDIVVGAQDWNSEEAGKLLKEFASK